MARNKTIIINRRIRVDDGGGEVKLQQKTATPSTSSQNVTPDAGYNGLSKVVVDAVDSSIDNNISAENIKKNVDILGVTGTYEGEVDICNDLGNLKNMFSGGLRQSTDYALFCLKHAPTQITNTENWLYGQSVLSGVLDLSRFDWSLCVSFKAAFYNQQGLTKVIFTSDLSKGFGSLSTGGGNGALRQGFQDCTLLEEVVNFPINTVGTSTAGLIETKKDSSNYYPAFYGCTSLKRITFPQGCVPCSDRNSDITLTILYFTEAVTEADLLAMLATLGQNTTGKKREFKLHANVFPLISQETKDAFVAKGYALVE